METYPSICIPRANIIESSEVKTILEKLFGKATIDRVDVVPCKDVPQHCKIFIHMKYWPEDNNISNLRNRLINGNCINIVVRSDAPYQGLRGDAPYQGLRGDAPYQGLRGDAPYQGLRGDASYQGLRGDAPYQGLKGDAPYFWKCFMSRLPKPKLK